MPSIKHTDDAFKKTQQIVGKPKTTDHNIHEDYVRNPPNNDQVPAVAPSRSEVKLSIPQQIQEKAREDRRPIIIEERKEVLGVNQSLGREKKTDDLAEIARESSVHP
ncbi:hypothetical protein CC2G_002163 [Coprinopsis cinerea AmutBmut pab1-1]|nr:hypothetical protein CC2G_002163 [Coprinopsis cinerea AmutBmut pab1-1]